MRKFVISVAVAGAALVAASPASAQYYPQPQPYGYGAPYGHAYGYQNNWGQVRSLQVRVDRIQRELVRLVRVRAISRDEFRNRNEDARDIERRLRRDFRDGRGLNGNEIYGIERRIARLEQRIARDTRDGNRWGYNGYNGQYGQYIDRDRDGRNDRYEDDRGWRRD